MAVGVAVTMAAAAMTSTICSRKEAHSTHRRLGEKHRWNELKNMDPTQKQPNDVIDFIHRVDSCGAARPSPM